MGSVTLDASLKDSLTKSARKYADSLAGTPGESYLEGRGIGSDVSATFLLGYVADPDPGHQQFEGMLSIPYVTPTGVVSFKFRRLTGAGHKYDQPAGQTSRLYNVRALREHSDFILICEGEIDAVVAHGVCGLPAIGLPGVNNWKPHFPLVFEGYSRVYVLGDNDIKDDGSNPGQDMAKRVMQDLPQAVNILLPPGRDVNEFVVENGKSALADLVGV